MTAAIPWLRLCEALVTDLFCEGGRRVIVLGELLSFVALSHVHGGFAPGGLMSRGFISYCQYQRHMCEQLA